MAKANFLESQDTDLILACRQGDQEAWATLVARYQKLIYTIPRRAGLDEDQCADIFQQTFQTLFQHIDRLEFLLIIFLHDGFAHKSAELVWVNLAFVRPSVRQLHMPVFFVALELLQLFRERR